MGASVGSVKGSVVGSVRGSVAGSVTGSVSGSVIGDCVVGLDSPESGTVLSKTFGRNRITAAMTRIRRKIGQTGVRHFRLRLAGFIYIAYISHFVIVKP